MTLRPRSCAAVEEGPEVVESAVLGVDGAVVGDVVAVVAEGRRVHRQEPDAVDTEGLQVIEAGHEAGKVPHAVPVRVGVGLDVQLVEDGVLVPEVVAHARSVGVRYWSLLRGGGRRRDQGRHRVAEGPPQLPLDRHQHLAHGALAPGEPGGDGVAAHQDRVERGPGGRVGARAGLAHLVEERRGEGLGLPVVAGDDRVLQGQELAEQPAQAGRGLGPRELGPGVGELLLRLGRLGLRLDEPLSLRPVAGHESPGDQQDDQDGQRSLHVTLLAGIAVELGRPGLRRGCRSPRR